MRRRWIGDKRDEPKTRLESEVLEILAEWATSSSGQPVKAPAASRASPLWVKPRLPGNGSTFPLRHGPLT
jgi:hypothetical protein